MSLYDKFHCTYNYRFRLTHINRLLGISSFCRFCVFFTPEDWSLTSAFNACLLAIEKGLLSTIFFVHIQRFFLFGCLYSIFPFFFLPFAFGLCSCIFLLSLASRFFFLIHHIGSWHFFFFFFYILLLYFLIFSPFSLSHCSLFSVSCVIERGKERVIKQVLYAKLTVKFYDINLDRFFYYTRAFFPLSGPFFHLV